MECTFCHNKLKIVERSCAVDDIDCCLETQSNSNSNNLSDKFATVRNSLESCNDNLSNEKKLPSVYELVENRQKLRCQFCETCAEMLKTELNEEIENLDFDIDHYRAYLNKIENADIGQRQPDSGQAPVEDLTDQVTKLQDEYETLLSDVEKSQRSLQLLCDDENKLIGERNRLRHDLRLSHESAIALANDEDHDRELLAMVLKCNVFNIAFHISFEDERFGMINGCRVGMMSEGTSADWFEINLGIGYIAHAVCSIAADIGMEYERYKIFPLANYSYIEETVSSSTIKKLPLFNSNRKIVIWSSEYKFNFIFTVIARYQPSFDVGLTSLLNCFKQFMNAVSTRDSHFHFPYSIDGYYLMDSEQSRFSIRYFGNKKELWTKAFKLFLTNLKWSFAWLTAHIPD